MGSSFRPKRVSKGEMDEMIQDCIEGAISPDADAIEIKWWCAVIPEALRYCMRKRKKVARLIEDIEIRLDEIDAKCKLVYIHSSRAPQSNITERKDFAEAMKVAKSKEYKELRLQLAMFNEVYNNCEVDITNLQEKSYMVRKYANMETTNRMVYDD